MSNPFDVPISKKSALLRTQKSISISKPISKYYKQETAVNHVTGKTYTLLTFNREDDNNETD